MEVGKIPNVRESGMSLIRALEVSGESNDCEVVPGTWRPPVVQKKLFAPPIVLTPPIETSDEADEEPDEAAEETEAADESGNKPTGEASLPTNKDEPAINAAFMREWETVAPLDANLNAFSLRRLAGLATIGDIAHLLVRGEPVLDAFDARHAQVREILLQLDEELGTKRVPPETLVAEALEERVSAALDRTLTAETQRLPRDIRLLVVRFRRARDRRVNPLRAFSETSVNLDRLHILLDACESGLRGEGSKTSSSEVDRFGELIATSDIGFAELERIEAELAGIEAELELHRDTFLTLCERARETETAIAQIRASASVLQIPISDSVSEQMSDNARALLDATDTYAEEMNASFGTPERNASVLRLASELPNRKVFHASLVRPRASNVLTAVVADRDEEIRRLILLTYAIACKWELTKGRGTKTILNVMTRVGFIHPDEAEHAKSLMMDKIAKKWRKTHYIHTPLGIRGHLYCPNDAGYALARTYLRNVTDARSVEESVRKALRERDDEFYAERAANAKKKNAETS